MDDSTLLVFKLIGPIFFVMGLALVVNLKYFYKSLKNVDEESPLFVLIMGGVSMLLGLLILTKHNLWSSVDEIIVSVFGCLAVVKGVLLLLVPKWLLKFATNVYSTTTLTVGGIVILVFGGYLSWVAYFV
jgi:hypothetical protein